VWFLINNMSQARMGDLIQKYSRRVKKTQNYDSDDDDDDDDMRVTWKTLWLFWKLCISLLSRIFFIHLVKLFHHSVHLERQLSKMFSREAGTCTM